MANSESKAIKLKDAYIKGVQDAAGPEATAAAGRAELADLAGKLGMEQGNTASYHTNLDRGTHTATNDGHDKKFMTYKGNTFQTGVHPNYGYPLSGEGRGASNTINLSTAGKARAMQELERLQNHHGLDVNTGLYRERKKFLGIF